MRNPTPSNKGFWSPSEWYLAQVVHLLSGALIVACAGKQGWHMGWTVGIFMILTAAKEYLVDCSPFEGDSLRGSTQDTFFYWAGALGGLLDYWNLFWVAVIWVVVWVLVLFVYDMISQRTSQPAQTDTLPFSSE